MTSKDTKDDVYKAVITFKDTVRNLVGITGVTDARRVSSMQRGRGHGGKGGYGRGYGRGGRRTRGGGRGGRHSNGQGRGYGGGRQTNRGYNNDGQRDSNYIPNEILENLPPKYKAMMFEGTDVMEVDNQDNRKRSAHSASSCGSTREDDNERRQSSKQQRKRKEDEEDYNGHDDEGNASSQFGYSGNKKRKGDSSTSGSSRPRSIGQIISSRRRVRMTTSTTIDTGNDLSLRARANIDTKADTICAGATFKLHEDTGKVVDLSGFHNSLESIKDITVDTSITAVDLDDKTIIAVFPQSLYFGKGMKDLLIPPAEMWDYGMVVDVVPKQYSSGKSLHGIYHHDENVTIPFNLHGCMFYIPMRLPTRDEKENCRWIQFTSEKGWQPYNDKFRLAENAMINHTVAPDLDHQHHIDDRLEANRRSVGKVSIMSMYDVVIDNDPSLCTFDTIYNDNARQMKLINLKKSAVKSEG